MKICSSRIIYVAEDYFHLKSHYKNSVAKQIEENGANLAVRH